MEKKLIATIAIVVVHAAQRRDSVILDVLIGRRCPTPQGNMDPRRKAPLPPPRALLVLWSSMVMRARVVRSISQHQERETTPRPRGVPLIMAIDCERQRRVLGTATHGQKNSVDSILPG